MYQIKYKEGRKNKTRSNRRKAEKTKIKQEEGRKKKISNRRKAGKTKDQNRRKAGTIHQNQLGGRQKQTGDAEGGKAQHCQRATKTL